MCFKKSSKLNYFQITIIIFRYKNQNQSPTVTINKCDRSRRNWNPNHWFKQSSFVHVVYEIPQSTSRVDKSTFYCECHRMREGKNYGMHETRKVFKIFLKHSDIRITAENTILTTLIVTSPRFIGNQIMRVFAIFFSV